MATASLQREEEENGLRGSHRRSGSGHREEGAAVEGHAGEVRAAAAASIWIGRGRRRLGSCEPPRCGSSGGLVPCVHVLCGCVLGVRVWDRIGVVGWLGRLWPGWPLQKKNSFFVFGFYKTFSRLLSEYKIGFILFILGTIFRYTLKI